GINDTVKILNGCGCATFGVSSNEEYDIYRKTIEGVNFSFIAAVKSGRWESSGLGPNIIDQEKLELLIEEEKGSADHVILFFHWGTELVDAPDPADVKVAHKLIDAGASCVIGHHPHVSQGVEEYSGGLIAYSLGSHVYLSECEKGNADSNPIRDISICLNIKFSKEKIIQYKAFKFMRKASVSELVPANMGEFSEDAYFSKLNSVIGDGRYYSSMIRKVLIKREVAYFFVRFKKAPLAAVIHYASYLKLAHLKKIFG
ncbi:MAG: CapA family protein, partial [Colwellia sp.]